MKKEKKERKILVGKVYADWCPHCQKLQPTWEDLKQSLEKEAKSRGFILEMVDVEESQKEELENLKKANPDLKADSFPTIFRREEGGSIEYYNGSRELHDLKNWALNTKDSKKGGKKKKASKKRSKKSKSQSQRKSKKRAKTSKNKISQFTSLFSFGK